MTLITEIPSDNSGASKSKGELKCESCEGLLLQAVPGEAEALSLLGEVCGALKEFREMAERMDLSLLLVDSDGAGGENQDEKDVQETESQESNDELGGQGSRSSLGLKNEAESAETTEKLVEIVASRIIRKCGRKSMRITLSSKADTLSKENDDRTGSAKAGISNRLSPPEDNIAIPINDLTTSQTTATQAGGSKKKTWNFFKFLFGSRKRK